MTNIVCSIKEGVLEIFDFKSIAAAKNKFLEMNDIEGVSVFSIGNDIKFLGKLVKDAVEAGRKIIDNRILLEAA